MFSSQRRGRESVNIWPGFVDALATVLLAFIFLILLFVVAQFYLSDVLSERNTALARLEEQVAELGETLAMERRQRRRVEEKLSETYTELHSTLSERDQLSKALRVSQEEARRLKEELAAADEEIETTEEKLKTRLSEIASLQADIDALRKVREELEAEVGDLAGELDSTRETLETTRERLGQARDRSKALRAELAESRERTNLAQETVEEREIRIERLVAQIEEQGEALSEQKSLTADAQDRIDRLRAEIRALRDQIASLSDALNVSRETVSSQRERIENLGERLNAALAKKVEELSRYRSEFFGRLREVLGNIDEIRVVGDRFMFQSELFFASASASIGADGKQKLDRLASILQEVAARIPGDIPWVLQVEGHTDPRPISTEEFPSNWELSTARATNIVHYLIDQGIAPRRLAAVGYGEYQPIASGDNPEAYARNRRIELRLTSR